MKRGASVAVVVLLLAGILWFVRGRKQDQASVPEGVMVGLRVDGGSEASIERGEPLLLEVFLQGRTDTSSATLGSAATPWPRLVSLRRDPDVPLNEAVVLGAPRVMGVVFAGGTPSLLADDDQAIATIAGLRRTYSVAMGLSPEVTSTLPTGRQTIKAVVGAETSFPVSVIVTEPTPGRELERLRRSAKFSVRAGRYEAGKKIAEDVLARQANDVAAHTTIGDALNGLGRLPEARAAYLKALAALRSGRQFYEEPESLFARIREVERALSATRR